MKKKETWTEEYKHCGECLYVMTNYARKHRCTKTRRLIKDLWGEIPDWCTLETVEEK